MGGIVLVTDHSSKEESRPKLSAAVELLTGAPPITVDARHFMPGGDGRARIVDGALTLEVRSEGLLVTPAVVIVYEIPPTDRRRFERFLQVMRRSGVSYLDADPGAWRNTTEKNRTVRRFQRDTIPHMETISLRRPSPATAVRAFRRLGLNVWARPTIGFGGEDVFHLTCIEEVNRAVRYYSVHGQDWMMSRDTLNFTVGGRRHQYRVIVLDDRVLRVCEHVQESLDAPCNEAQGAVSTVLAPEDLPSDFLELAVSATRSLGLRFGGVDLAIENGGVVFEVNVHPVLAPVGGFETVAVPYVEAHLEAIAPATDVGRQGGRLPSKTQRGAAPTSHRS